jgi:hypothetical protein
LVLQTSTAVSFGTTAPFAAPLSALTSPKVPFKWFPAVDKAFVDLKHWFTTAPILIHPVPSRQFVVEVDASDIGSGAILSKQSAQDQKLHPCAFLSHRLNPAERNYDVGNREPKAVNMALEEWRHWLQGAEQPFLVWTNQTKTWRISVRPSASTPGKPGGSSCLPDSTSPFPTAQDKKM